MKTNQATLERVLRVLVGLVLLALTLTGTIGVWGWIGVVPIATGLMGWCPAYTLLGFNTCPMKQRRRRARRSRQGPRFRHRASLARRRRRPEAAARPRHHAGLPAGRDEGVEQRQLSRPERVGRARFGGAGQRDRGPQRQPGPLGGSQRGSMP